MGSKRYDSEWREVQVINGYAVLMAYSSFVFRGIGFLVVTWNTVVLLGGFVSMIKKFHFWSLALITLVEILWINASFSETFGSFRDLLSSLSTVNSVLKRKWPLVDNDPKPRGKKVVQVVLVVVGWFLAPLHLLVSYMCIISVGCLMVFGMVISTLISVIGLRNLHYYGDADEERTNLDPACNIAYFLCLIQSALILHLLILRFSQTLIVKQVSRAYGFPNGRAVEGYLHALRAGCLKKPASATGRNLITYAIELMQSKESDSCLAGTLILERLIIQDGTTTATTHSTDLSKVKVVAGAGQRSKDNSAGAHVNIEVKEPLKMVIIEQQRRLIKKLIGSAGYAHILQKLLETLDWRSPDDREMRVAAARIVDHVATGGGIRLEQFPRGIQCISSLLSTFHESDWSSSSLVSNADNTNQLQRYIDLVLTGLRILWSLASSDDNFTVMSNTKHLLSKIMAHVSHHDRVHRSDHGEGYSNVVEGSLKVMLRFVTAEGENAVELRRQISSSHSAMAAMETILKCEDCKGRELQMNAMQILAQLRMVKTASRGNQTEMLVDIFTNGRDSSIRSMAGKTLVMLFLGSTSVATTLSEAGAGFVDSLVKILLQVGDSDTSCRQSAAEILELLCVHYDENDENFSTLKKAMADVMPKVDKVIDSSVSPVVMSTPVSQGFSRDEAVAFGGIQSEEVKGVRSSGRIRAQFNADAPQLERAMLIAQRRDDLYVQGYSSSCALDPTMGFPSPGGPAQGYGYWVQPAAGGHSGLLFPGYWMATQ